MNAIEAPKLDLDFIEIVVSYFYKEVSTVIAKNKKPFVGPAFFDESVPLEIKKMMVQKLDIGNDIHRNSEKISKRKVINMNEIFSYSSRDVSDFVSPVTKKLFSRLAIDLKFLESEPSQWQHLNVLNDTAERAIKLITSYNKSLKYNEIDNQYLLQVVEHYRHLYPSQNKSSVINESTQ